MILTAEQRSAINFPRNILVTACPGSGKTKTIVSKLLHEIDQFKDTPKSIACLTYTNSAVQEIEQRVAPYTSSSDSSSFVVATIHSFCFSNIFRPFAWKLSGFKGIPKVLTPESEDFRKIADYAALQVNYSGLSASDYETFEGLNININGEIIGIASENEIVKRAAPFFWKRCEEAGYIDFCNIIYKSYILLRDNPEILGSISSRYEVFLIDEFQDTTEIQIEIFKLIHSQGKTRFFLVGDLAQSIYSFTGARPELVLPFANHIGAKVDLSLSGNFRSNPQIISNAELIFPRSPPMTSVGSNRSCKLLPEVSYNRSSYSAITEIFLPTLSALGIPYGSATILSRTWQPLYHLSRQLRESGVPVVGPGARPYRRSRLFATLAEQICGVLTEWQPDSLQRLERALFHTILDATGENRLDVYSFKGRLLLIRILREAERLSTVGDNGVNWLDSMSVFVGLSLYESGFIDYEHVSLFFSSVQEMKADMQRQKVDVNNLTIEDLGMFANPSTSLRLSTIHFSKGREYDAVAIVGMVESSIPFYKARTSEEIEDERRLFYVASTRAKRLLLYISEPNKWGNAPSRFLPQQGVLIRS